MEAPFSTKGIKLASMKQVMTRDPEVQADFEVALVSLINLRREGVARLTSELLARRMELVRFILRTFGIPAEGFMVVAASEATQHYGAHRLVNLKTDTGMQLGALVPFHPSRSSSSTLPRPHDDKLIRLLSRATLFTDKPADAQVVRDKFGGQERALALIAPKREEEASPSRAQTKTGKKALVALRTAISASQLLLPHFSSDDWQDLKESAFTTPLTKLLAAKLDLAHESLTASVQCAEDWHENVCSLKQFIKKYKEVERAKKSVRNAKFGSMSDVAFACWAFLKTQQAVSLSFQKARLVCVFFADPELGLALRFQEQIDVELLDVLVAWEKEEPGQVTPSGWLRVMFLDYICPLIKSWPVDDVEAQRDLLAQDLQATRALMEGGAAKDCLLDLAQDVAMLEALLQAHVEKESPTSSTLMKAEAHILTEARLALLKETLTKTEQGAEIMSPIAQKKVLSANDKLGDANFAMGMDAFAAPEMVRTEFRVASCSFDASPIYLIFAAEAVAGTPMPLTGMLEDAFGNVLEGVRLWQGARREAKSLEVQRFCRMVAAAVTSTELVFAANLAAACLPHFKENAAIVSGDQRADVMQSTSAAIRAGVEAGGTANTTAPIRKMLLHMKQDLVQWASLTGTMDKLIDTLQKNHEKRMAITDNLKLIGAMCTFGVPKGARQAVDQWCVHKGKSCLGSCLALVSRMSAMAELGKFDFSGICMEDTVADFGTTDPADSHMSARVMFGEVSEQAGCVTMGDIVSLHERMADLPVVSFARGLVADCAVELMASICSAADLSAFKPPAGEPDSTNAKTFISHYISPVSLTQSVLSLSKLLQQGQRSVELDSCDLVKLLEEVLLVSTATTVNFPVNFMMPPRAAKTSVALSYMKAFMHLHHVMAGLAWVHNMCCQHGGPVVKHEFRKDVEVVLDMISVGVDAAIAEIDSMEAFVCADYIVGKLAVKMQDVHAWLVSLQVHIAALYRLLYHDMMKSLAALTKLVKSHIPEYDHYLNDEKCQVRLVQQKLMVFAGKSLLQTESVALFHLIAASTKFATVFGISQVADSGGETYNEEMMAAQAAFTSGKKMMAIHKAANIIWKVKDRAAIKTLVDAPAGLPAAMVRAAQAELSKKKPESPAAASVKVKKSLP